MQLQRKTLFAWIIVLLTTTNPLHATQCQKPTTDPDQSIVLNELLKQGGIGKIIQLCPNTVYGIYAPIVFTAPFQGIETEGVPKGPSRAILSIEGTTQSTAIIGQCTNCSNISIRNIQVAGNRTRLGHIKDGKALIEMGGAVHKQSIRNVKATDPRGWSTIRVFEGQNNCNEVEVIENEIGPAGTDDGNWADGISYACRNGQISNNTIIDATDGGIVIFQAPGSIVEGNTIKATTRTMLGGINLVDFEPYKGDYNGTVVTRNNIIADGSMIKVGIAIGHDVWWTGPKSKILRGAVVVNYRLIGEPFGYGIAVSGVKDFTVAHNSTEGALFKGILRCPNLPAAEPKIIHKGRSEGIFDSAFKESGAELSYLICIAPSSD